MAEFAMAESAIAANFCLRDLNYPLATRDQASVGKLIVKRKTACYFMRLHAT
jgi:hypothetical protein